MLRDGQPGPQGQWGLCMRAVIQLHAEGVTSGGVGMQTTSTHALLSSDPGGSGQRHSPALLHLVTRASSGPGTLKTTLSTPSCPPGAPLLGAQVDPPLKATGLASSQSSAPLYIQPDKHIFTKIRYNFRSSHQTFISPLIPLRFFFLSLPWQMMP